MCRVFIGVLVLGLSLWAAAAQCAEPAAKDLLQALRSPDEAARLRGIDTLANRGARIPGAVAALSEQLRDPSAKVRVRAADALGQIGPNAGDAGAALGELLNDPNLHVRRAAIRALAKIRANAQVSVALFMKALEDSDAAVRLGALDALTELGKDAVPSLIEALKHDLTAYWACLALGELGEDAEPAKEELQRLLRTDRRMEVRREAALALGAVGAPAASAVPTLVSALGENDLGVRLSAAFALGRMGPKAKPAESALRKLTGTGSPPLLRALGVWALARIRPEDQALAQKAVVLLLEAMRNKDPSVRAMAVRGLADLRAAPNDVVPAMNKIVEEGPPELRKDALAVLFSIGEPAVPALMKALRFPDSRARAAVILGRIGPAAKTSVPALIEVVKGDDPVARRQALVALAAMGPAARAAVPAAIQSMRDADMLVRYSACYAIGKMGVTAAEAKPALQRELDSSDPYLALAAAWALARIDPDCASIPPKALPMLIKALSDNDPLVRLEAASSMRCLGPQAKSAAAALRQMVQEDPSDLVRDMAAEALKAIQE